MVLLMFKTVSVALRSRLSYQETNLSAPPEKIIQGYRFGAKLMINKHSHYSRRSS